METGATGRAEDPRSVLLGCHRSAPEGGGEHHQAVRDWLDGLSEFYTTSIVELGFMRVSLSPAYAATWKTAHRSLSGLLNRPSHRFLDVSATDSEETNYKDSTDALLSPWQIDTGFGLRLWTRD